MHFYYWDKERLREALREFSGGQLLMETREGLVFRGEISRCFVPNGGSKRVLVFFNWLSERRFVLDEWWELKPKWFLYKPSVGVAFLDIGFTTYYPQPDEDRLKMWGELGEICHFFKSDDHTNLVKQGDNFVTYCQIHDMHQLRRVAIALLLSDPQQYPPSSVEPLLPQPLTSSAHST